MNWRTPHNYFMANDRILVPTGSASWPVAAESEQQVVMTIFRIHQRKKLKFKTAGLMARIYEGSSLGTLLMELTGAELKLARDLIARASVETANYIDGADSAVLKIVPYPKDSPVCLEFAHGSIRVCVNFSQLGTDEERTCKRSIWLHNRGYRLELPHFDCLA